MFAAKREALKRRVVRLGRDLGGAQRRSLRVVSGEAAGEEMPAAAIRAGLLADPSRWLDKRLFHGEQPLIFDNVLGRFTRLDARALGRDQSFDLDTGASQLFRSLMYAFTRGLGLHPVLPHNTGRQSLRGIGLSDNRYYARVLGRRFAYTNTFFHKRPYLDICAQDLPYSGLDFIISSEVFEHVPPPADVAFRNSWRMLKPGGVLILTVPYGDRLEQTVEHYPSLHDWSLKQRGADYYIENVDARGQREEFDKVIFHGGPGQTVEMRIFAKRHLLELAARNGFSAEIVSEDVPLFGIWNQGDPDSLPLILRKL